jgi:hypothetical protein
MAEDKNYFGTAVIGIIILSVFAIILMQISSESSSPFSDITGYPLLLCLCLV